MYHTIRRIGIAGTITLAMLAGSNAYAGKPLKLKIIEPRGPNSEQAAMLESDWMLSFHIAAKDETAGFFDGIGSDPSQPNFKTFIVRDPDNCLDLSHAAPWLAGIPLNVCPGGPDEILLPYELEEHDKARQVDSSLACQGAAQARLVDTPYADIESGTVLPRDANKVFVDANPLVTTSVSAIIIGPDTGGTAASQFGNPFDCYGYGADEDLSSLVVMINIGAARVFDTALNYDNSRIRNMAGFMTNTSTQLLDKKGRSALVGHMRITSGMLEPITFIDVNAEIFGSSADTINPTFLRKIDDGPIETINLTGSFSPAEMVAEIHKQLPGEYEVEIRAVVVEGQAPDFIDDNNGDGKFTAADLTSAATPYTLLSNEARRWITVYQREVLTTEAQAFECPRTSALKFVDFDGNDLAGFCDDGDGSSRSVRRALR